MNKYINYISEESNRNKLAPFISILLGFLIGGILIFLLGRNPFAAYYHIIRGSIFKGLFQGDLARLGNTLLITTTLILTGLSVAFAFKTGLFNIGVSGQMLFGGFLATIFGLTFDHWPKFILLPLSVLIAVLGGALWASVPGILKAKYRINEVVVAIMMNYSAVWVVHYFIRNYFTGELQTYSKPLPNNALLRVDWMTKLFNGSFVNLALFLAIITAVIIWFILDKTVFGYELKAVGFNHDAAKYAGMKVNRNILLSFVISGAIAGLAGASYYIGYVNKIEIGLLPTHGFDGIAVSLLGLNTPIGVVLSAFLFGVLRNGGEFINAMPEFRMPKQLIDIIISLIIYFAAASLLIKDFLKKLVKKAEVKKDGTN